MNGSIELAGRFIGAGLAMIGAAGAGVGIGLSVQGALGGMARNPDAYGNLLTNMILGMLGVLCEPKNEIGDAF